MENKDTVVASSTNSGLKNFIIGKMWINSQDGSRAGSIKINRDLPCTIALKADTTIYLHTNTKREGKNDADYSVSILLPTSTTDGLIAKVNAARKEANEAPEVEVAVKPY